MDATSQDPEVLGGELVFAGTRVPVRSLFDHLEGGDSIEEFLEGFPSVRPGQVMAVLQEESLSVKQYFGVSVGKELTSAHEEIRAMLKDSWNAEVPTEAQRWKSAKKQQLAETIREALTKK